MPLLNPWQLTPPKQREEAFVLKDKAQPNQEVALRLRQLSVAETLAAQSAAQKLIEEFVTGIDGEPPNAYPAPVPVVMSEQYILDLCSLSAMEVPQGEPPQKFGFDGLLGLSVMFPGGFLRLREFATKLNRNQKLPETEDDEGNPPRKARGNSSSARPSVPTSATPS